ncbi:DNA polymerase III subunit gamma/tau [Lacticaseibacillus mingshuiensis]|uniref:DNA-directed DNA polymerase n=1 Tax=Lacticaseibacillus mingshuiensis TaxID=2799574 RepID=A0ABW4CFY8_9LACO|nr:DNA polymerase III subunit gamma/tau [Lacticaseibacillus mingshuiensis]
MAYQALYRVWRPQQFADVIGQEAIVRTLKNALITGQTSHAYLFTGPRGTGKTSVAKILAKALNCEHLQDGEPDNTCELCVAMNEGRLTDVIEIDAASNNGVDEIRDIRDKAKYAPTQARVKVYIIDEVHMLSTGAFNALLKTLEEPPAHVVFILATTEPQKIPATIISRTQRFDFRRITPEDLIKRMAFILDDKGITYDDTALAVIARAAEGGMRDALSILDQVMAFGDDHVTTENALDVTGSASTAELGVYLAAIASRDVAKALTTIAELLAAGKDAGRLIEDLIEYLRDLLVYQAAPSLIDATQAALLDDAFKDLAGQLSAEQLYHMIDVLNETQQQLRLTNHPALYLQVATVRLGERPAVSVPVAQVDPAGSQEVADLAQQVTTLKEALGRLTAKSAPASAKGPARKKGPKQVDKAHIYPILEKATKGDLESLKEVWPDLLSMLTPPKRAMMNVSKPVAASPDGVIVQFQFDIFVARANSDETLMAELENGLERLTGKRPVIVLVEAVDWPDIRSTYLKTKGAPTTQTKKKPQADPVVKTIGDLFGQADNITIKND